MDYDPRYNVVYRLRPRDNLDVNRFWMCDDGMMTYRRLSEGRVVTAVIGRGNATEEWPLGSALEQTAKALQPIDGSRIGFVLSAQHATEDNFVLAKLAKALGSDRLYLAALGGWEGDHILRDHDNNPNKAGAMLAAGQSVADLGALLSDVRTGQIDAVIALGWASAEDSTELAPLAHLPVVVSLTSNVGALPSLASHVVPVAAWGEMHGTFVNVKGLQQEFRPAVRAPFGVSPAWETLVRLGKLLGHELTHTSIKAIRAELFPAPRPTGPHAPAEANV